MSDVAIRVAGLGKQYRLGGTQERYHTLGDQVRKWTSLRRLLRRRTRDEKRPPFWALRNVSFEVKRGEVVGVIGRNGAGKSTLLKILSRITEPTEGEADIHGRVGSLLEVGTGFHPELTGRENVYLNGAILGMRRTEIVRKFDEIVAFAEVEKFIDTPVKHYSSGMYMRLAFAVAAHLEPEILIVDEVLAVGDAEFQKKCLGKMGEVAEAGRTVLFVSHNMQAIQRLCKRVIVLDRGSIRADQGVREGIREYTGSGSEFCQERVWTFGDPGNADSRAHLRRARVLTEDEQTGSVIEISRSFSIEIEYANSEMEARPTAIIQVFNEAGECLFSSNEFNSPTWEQKRLAARVVKARCLIPPNLLAEGTFSVLVAVGSYNPNVVYAVERDALTFQIVDPMDGKGVRGPHVGDWPGLVRPWLDWTVENAETA